MLSFTQPICSYLAAIQRRINSPVSSAIGSLAKFKRSGRWAENWRLPVRLMRAARSPVIARTAWRVRISVNRPVVMWQPTITPFAPGNRSYDDRSPLPSNNVLTQKVW